MAETFRAQTAYMPEQTHVEEFVPDPTAVFLVGDCVYLDTATQTLKKCGADPALILAVSEVDSVKNALITPNGKVPVRIINQDIVYQMMPNAAFTTEANVGVAYGIVDAGSGLWKVDFSDTTNTRVVVLRVDIPTQRCFVKFLAANVQLDAVAS